MSEERPKNAVDLLTTPIEGSGWEYTLGERRAFYIRGVTWLRRSYLSSAAQIVRYAEELPNFLPEYEEMLPSGFNWSEQFSPRQALDAISLNSGRPLKFTKAVLTIISCDLVARRIFEPDSDAERHTAFGRMFIEPSLFYIRDFDSEFLAEIQGKRGDILDILRDRTSQVSREVFLEMADGRTVTKELAEQTRRILLDTIEGISVGAVDYRPRGRSSQPATKQIVA